MFSFSKGPFLGSMSIFRVVLLLTSTSVVLLKCHVMSIVIILLSKKYGFTFQKMTQSCPLQHRKNEIQTFPTFLFWMSWTVFFSLSREKMTLMFTDNDAWTSSFWGVLVPGGYPFTSNAPGNSQVDQPQTAQKGSRLLAGIVHSFLLKFPTSMKIGENHSQPQAED